MLRKRSIVIVAIVAASALATPDWSVGEDETIWTMVISGTRVEEPSGPVFEMWVIEYKSGTLTFGLARHLTMRRSERGVARKAGVKGRLKTTADGRRELRPGR